MYSYFCPFLLLVVTLPLAAAIRVRTEPAPANDYFHRSALVLTVDPLPQKPVWLVLEYEDRGYGLILTEPGVSHTRQWGVARLNSGRTRRAWFGFEKAPRTIRVRGLAAVKSATLAESEPPRDPLPQVEPAVRFQTFPQRIISSGADANSLDGLPEALATMKNLLPLARGLGFNGIESYVKWNFIERSRGVFDFSFYDAICDELDRHGMQWFPLLIVGSAYSLPQWFHDSADSRGFACLEHGISADIQSIFCGRQDEYVQRFLREFGKHYGPRKTLLGVRLGPSGNYGEAQYPARGALGYMGQPLHTHHGYWAADECASPHFRKWLQQKYATIGDLNRAWESKHGSFEEIKTFMPVTALTNRQRIDFSGWYIGAMSEWCERWAVWSREAMPGAVIHQSSGGWGPIHIGTDFSYQARSMVKVQGGIRLTNESDNFADNVSITRMASSAARFYGVPLGYEPGGFGSARGVLARLFNCLTNDGVHLFYYHPNLYFNDQGVDKWLRHAPLLEQRAKPVIDVGVFYPDTAIKLDDEPLRFRWGSVFLVSARGLRSALDYDYVSEQMIDDGALQRFKVLVVLWGNVTEKRILEKIGAWVKAGGTVIYPRQPRGPLVSVEGDGSDFNSWEQSGRLIHFEGDPQPPDYYARFVREQVGKLPGIRESYRQAVRMKKPDLVYWSVLETGKVALLNFSDEPAMIEVRPGRRVALEPYSAGLF